MLYKLLGFSQKGTVRRYAFQRVGIDARPEVFAVDADMALARKYNVGLQELPGLCSRLLIATGEDGPSGPLSLTEAHLGVCAAANAAIAAEVAANKELRSRRGALANAAKKEKLALATAGRIDE